MKAYTDLEQSKKLAQILPLESADMCYPYDRHLNKMYGDIPYVMDYKRFNEDTDFPCWSLSALLDVLDFPSLTQNKEDEWEVCVPNHKYDEYIEVSADNPVDACYEMILKLHEQKLL